MRILKVALLFSIFATVSCKHIPFEGVARRIQVPDVLNERYMPLGTPLEEKIKVLGKNKTYSVSSVELKFRHEDGQHRKTTFLYYRTNQKGEIPTLTVLPITGGNYQLSRFFASWLARNGYNAVVVYRPKRWFAVEDGLEEMERLFRLSVIEQRSVLQWLRQRPEVDTMRMGTLGTSLGALGSVVVNALEPDLKANFVVMGGQNAPEMMMVTREKGITKWRNFHMKIMGVGPEEFKKRLKKYILSDPLHFSKYIDPEKTVQIITLKDKSVPTRNQWELWESMGKPEAYTFNIGHYTSVVYIKPFMTRLRQHLRLKL